jgi:lipoate-protein ligase A
MRLTALQPPDALSALAAEEAALEAVDSGAAGPAWLLWTSPGRAAVLGTSRPASGDLFLDRLSADGVPVWRRRSGGGTVLLGPESPAVTCVERLPHPGAGSIRESYRAFCDVLVAAFARLGLEARFEPPADLAIGERKIAGLAQRRKRRAVLVTASVLARPLGSECARYLRQPSPEDSPAYRAGRSHADFMTSLAAEGLADPAGRFLDALRSELSARGAAVGVLTAGEAGRAAEIAGELAAPEWRFRF